MGAAARPVAGAGPSASAAGRCGAADGQQRLHAYLGSEDGLDAVFGAGLGKAHGAVKAVVVGESQGRLPHLGCAGDQLFDPAATIEEREVRVYVQVDEGSRRRAAGGRRRSVYVAVGRGAHGGAGARLLLMFLERLRAAELVHGTEGSRRGVGRRGGSARWRLAVSHNKIWLVL